MDTFIYSRLDEQKGATSAQTESFSISTEEGIERQTSKLAMKEPEFNINGTALNSI
ncbi:hypothetical protein [Bacillus mesophilum]|uniref:hypothetical protein n=1 Tax=Bacillus mesophilum TaxID=1071718 RepID=UPI001376112C|nr:hypothetical protein [Bacillus mesophilum]